MEYYGFYVKSIATAATLYNRYKLYIGLNQGISSVLLFEIVYNDAVENRDFLIVQISKRLTQSVESLVEGFNIRIYIYPHPMSTTKYRVAYTHSIENNIRYK